VRWEIAAQQVKNYGVMIILMHSFSGPSNKVNIS
jgi:hypothetical protein